MSNSTHSNLSFRGDTEGLVLPRYRVRPPDSWRPPPGPEGRTRDPLRPRSTVLVPHPSFVGHLSPDLPSSARTGSGRLTFEVPGEWNEDEEDEEEEVESEEVRRVEPERLRGSNRLPEIVSPGRWPPQLVKGPSRDLTSALHPLSRSSFPTSPSRPLRMTQVLGRPSLQWRGVCSSGRDPSGLETSDTPPRTRD